MLKTIYEGYLPCVAIAIIGFNMLGGSALSWLAFVWLFGAVSTVAIAYTRSMLTSEHLDGAAMGAMENC